MTTRGLSALAVDPLGFCVIGNIVVLQKPPYTVDGKSVIGDSTEKGAVPAEVTEEVGSAGLLIAFPGTP
jgi:hypothetical protein